MADLARLKRGRLGVPPAPDEASPNLSAPELPPQPVSSKPPSSSISDAVEHMATRPDGRSLRRTNRIVPLALRVTPEFDRMLRDIAVREHLLLAEVLERALLTYYQRSQ